MSRSWPRWRNEQPSADFFTGEIAAELIELSGDTGLAVFHLVAAVEDGDLFGDVLRPEDVQTPSQRRVSAAHESLEGSARLVTSHAGGEVASLFIDTRDDLLPRAANEIAGDL